MSDARDRVLRMMREIEERFEEVKRSGEGDARALLNQYRALCAVLAYMSR